jgi:site-specific DNA-methyltransferase (adenine-specific)
MNSTALKNLKNNLDNIIQDIESQKTFRDKLFFSSKSNEWETPDGFYNRLDARFHFTLDAASTVDNKKCENHFTFHDNALEKDWSGNIVFLNPPYGKDLKYWVKKAYEEGKKDNTVVVVLIPARTDTKYFHEYCMKAKEIHFVKGRLKFRNAFANIENVPAPFPSMVVVFDGENDVPNFFTMNRI